MTVTKRHVGESMIGAANDKKTSSSQILILVSWYLYQCRLVVTIKDKKNFRQQIDRLDCEDEEYRSNYLS